MRKLGQAVCVLAATCAAAIGVSSAQDAPHPDPERIFAEARRVWDTQVYPTRIDYVVTVRVVQNGVEGVRHYAAEYAPTTNDLHVVATSIEQLAHPEDPHGITIRITREARGQKAFSIPVNPEASLDYLGVPLLAPTYSFGLARSRDTSVPATPEPSPSAGNEPEIIGSVIARARTYAVSYLGEERLPQGLAYHLALRPLRDPGRYRLRELWIEAATYRTLKAVTEGNFTDGPATRVNWTTTFQTIDGAQYIDTEKAEGPLRYGAQKFDEASISFERIRAHHGLPSLQFLFSQLPVKNALTEPKQ